MTNLTDIAEITPHTPAGEGGRQATSLPHAVLAMAARHPDRAAVVHGDTQLTYRDLAAQAYELAGRLRAEGVGREMTVAMCLPRTPALVAAVFGIWLAGGACLMMDPVAPPRRREHMLRDSGTRIAVTTEELAASLPADIRTLLLPGPGQANEAEPWHRGGVPTKATDLAYVIYTSGTTGRPKGVMVEHKTLSAMADSMEQALYGGRDPGVRRVALNGATSADPFFADFANLARGRTLVIVDEATRRDPERLGNLLRTQRIDLFDGTPTQLRALLLAVGAAALDSLKFLILGSEPIDADLWQQLRSLKHVRTHNYYGPTETTVYVTGAVLAEHPGPVIGTALPGNHALVLDSELGPVPDGEIGEICITGDQVARGYLNPGPAEQARFVLLARPGTPTPLRAYRTGDRGRYDSRGQLEFLGRFDNQVSINGHRVELGEIEYHLRACREVANTAVALLEGRAGEGLHAWIVLSEGTDLGAVRARLAESLPAHMIPRLVAVGSIPMNTAGKADIRSLTSLTAEAQQHPDSSQAAGEELPEILNAAWHEVLKADAIGASDHFFDIGGDSTRATQLTLMLRHRLGIALPIRTIFENPRMPDFQHAVSRHLTTVPADAQATLPA
ncbi:non-ribosomal peptide synthetase [Streptomyces sp. NPDC057697]|uniref:non-ribosomal peptide synthetase n=1 Tax=Streptomyces sp. NPDC057697 TaxID=3346219 RepID=UPI0036AF3E65